MLTRRDFVAVTAASLALVVSGCLELSSDDEGSGDVSESSLSLTNHDDTAYEVEVEIHDVSNDERLIEERLTVAPDDDIEYFHFTTERDESDNFPRVRAEVRMADDLENADSETYSFPATAGNSFAATIRQGGRIRVTINQV